MQNLKCQCCFKLLARTDGFNQIEIKCPRCKTLNTFQSTLSALPECPEQGIVPNNTGGFGSIKDAADVFYQNEIAPLQSRIQQLNEWAGDEIIRFKEYDLKNVT